MVQEMNTAELQEHIKSSPVPVVVDFWAVWCGPCRAQGPIIEKWGEKHGDKVSIVKLNVDQNGDYATQLGISSIPTIIAFSGGEEKGRGIGVQDEASLDNLLAKI